MCASPVRLESGLESRIQSPFCVIIVLNLICIFHFPFFRGTDFVWYILCFMYKFFYFFTYLFMYDRACQISSAYAPAGKSLASVTVVGENHLVIEGISPIFTLNFSCSSTFLLIITSIWSN